MSTRIVIVTGGFGVLGRAVSATFAKDGAAVARIDYAAEPSDKGDCDIGGVDLADPAAAARAIEEVENKLGAPAVLVNVAGGFIWQTMSDGGPETWERMF